MGDLKGPTSATVDDDLITYPSKCACGHDLSEHDRDGRCRHADFDDTAPGDLRGCGCDFFEPKGADYGAAV
jgi:hypothetical protein